ncbi:MAG: NAD(P)-dependent oxidoreductase, partial [Pseudomonadota bacterium]
MHDDFAAVHATAPQTTSPIAFISRHNGAHWLASLSAAMPNERIVGDDQLTDAQAAAVQIAIVADPAPLPLSRYRNLLWMHSVWAGVERLLPVIAERNIPLVRLIDPALTHTMSEAVLAWTLYLHRDMPAYAAQQRQRLWKQQTYTPTGELTVGLLGLGELGGAAAARLLGAGYRVCGWSQSAKQIDGVTSHVGIDGLQSVLEQSSILVVLLPLTPLTRNLLNIERIAMMPKCASLINFARGAVVDNTTLLAALDAGALSHAVLDVFEHEPLSSESALWLHPRVTVLPHISAPTNRTSAAKIVAENVV